MDASAPKILDRLVTSPVSELQFVRLPAEGKGQQLMAETDSEKRRAAHEVFRRLHRGRANLGMGRIPGTVGQDDSIRLVRRSEERRVGKECRSPWSALREQVVRAEER